MKRTSTMTVQHTEDEATPADEGVSGPPADEGHETKVEEPGHEDPGTFPRSYVKKLRDDTGALTPASVDLLARRPLLASRNPSGDALRSRAEQSGNQAPGTGHPPPDLGYVRTLLQRRMSRVQPPTAPPE
jgi:hypothetical protein